MKEKIDREESQSLIFYYNSVNQCKSVSKKNWVNQCLKNYE